MHRGSWCHAVFHLCGWECGCYGLWGLSEVVGVLLGGHWKRVGCANAVNWSGSWWRLVNLCAKESGYKNKCDIVLPIFNKEMQRAVLHVTNGCLANEPCQARTTKRRSVRSLSRTALNLRLCQARCHMWSFCLGNFRCQWIWPLGFCLCFLGGLKVETIWRMVVVISLPFNLAILFVAEAGL